MTPAGEQPVALLAARAGLALAALAAAIAIVAHSVDARVLLTADGLRDEVLDLLDLNLRR